jgi:hypothetical protein
MQEAERESLRVNDELAGIRIQLARAREEAGAAGARVNSVQVYCMNFYVHAWSNKRLCLFVCVCGHE